MNILALETSGPTMSIAISTPEHTLSLYENHKFNHCQNLLPAIDALISKTSITPSELDIVTCSAGPGSFTGLRIGLATAKGIARGAKRCALKTLPTLNTLAAGRETWHGIVIPVLDARKGRVYTSAFRNGKQIRPYQDIRIEDFLLNLPENEPVMLTGNDAPEIAQTLKFPITVDPLHKCGRAEIMAELAIKSLKETGPDPMDIGPLYLRLSEAEEKSIPGVQ